MNNSSPGQDVSVKPDVYATGKTSRLSFVPVWLGQGFDFGFASWDEF
jgi:hypothetical protein